MCYAKLTIIKKITKFDEIYVNRKFSFYLIEESIT